MSCWTRRVLVFVQLQVCDLRLLVLRKHGLWEKQKCMACSSLLPLVQVMDFGWVQFTEAKILSEYIKTDAYKMEVSHHASACWGGCSSQRPKSCQSTSKTDAYKMEVSHHAATVGVLYTAYLTSLRGCVRCELVSAWIMMWRPTAMSAVAASDVSGTEEL